MKAIILTLGLLTGTFMMTSAFGSNDGKESSTQNVAIDQSKIELYKKWSNSADTIFMVKKISSWHVDSLKSFYKEYNNVELSENELVELKKNSELFNNELKQQSNYKIVGKY